jgi:hypothetical protein
VLVVSERVLRASSERLGPTGAIIACELGMTAFIQFGVVIVARVGHRRIQYLC